MFITTVDKANLIIDCIKPHIMIITGPQLIGKTMFSNNFKHQYNVISLDKSAERARKIIVNKLKNHESVMIEGNITKEFIEKTMGDNTYSFVYLKPHNMKDYAMRLSKYYDDNSGELSKSNKLAKIKDIITNSDKEYEMWKEYTNQSMLVILI